jgi:hypothetical protein
MGGTFIIAILLPFPLAVIINPFVSIFFRNNMKVYDCWIKYVNIRISNEFILFIFLLEIYIYYKNT